MKKANPGLDDIHIVYNRITRSNKAIRKTKKTKKTKETKRFEKLTCEEECHDFASIAGVNAYLRAIR